MKPMLDDLELDQSQDQDEEPKEKQEGQDDRPLLDPSLKKRTELIHGRQPGEPLRR